MGQHKVLKEPLVCPDCGTACVRTSNKQKRCPACAYVHVLAEARKKAAVAAVARTAKRLTARGGAHVCKICEKALGATAKQKRVCRACRTTLNAKRAVRLYRKNPIKARLTAARQHNRRKARLRSLASPGVTLLEWSAIVEYFGGCCAYCLSRATSVDHLVPISRGGLDAPDNVVPACRSCNSSKNAKSLLQWVRMKGAA